MISLARTLDALAPHLPAALVPAEGYRATRAVAAGLPAALTRWTYLECRLGGRPAPPDLIVEVDAAGRGILAGTNRALAPAALAHPGWRRVAALCRAWEEARSPLATSVESLWLEFDVAASPPGAPVLPGVFIGLAPAARGGSAGAAAAHTAAALGALLGDALDERRRRAVEHFHGALPPGAELLYAGALLPRGDGALRLCAAGISARELPGFLRAVGWPGPYGRLRALLGALDAVREGAFARDPALLHLDVGADGVRPRLGLEYVFGRREQARGVLPDAAFVAHLAREGLCTSAEAAALAAYPGCATRHLPHELWRSLVVRRVNHVKLVVDGARPPEAKAYLVVHNRFWPRPVAPTGAAPGRGAGVERTLYPVEPVLPPAGPPPR